MEKIIILDNKKIRIDKEILSVGRAPDCEIRLNDDQVSRYHGKFIKKNDELFYEDNKSSNGSYLNNILVTGKKKVKEGDVIQIASFVLKIDLEIPTKKYPALETGAIKDGIICPSCGKTVGSDSKFCVFCGSPVKKLVKQNMLPCPECGKNIPVGSKYCNFCGIDLSAETYELKLTESTPVYMTVQEKSSQRDEDIKTIPLEDLVPVKQKEESKKEKIVKNKRKAVIKPQGKRKSLKIESEQLKINMDLDAKKKPGIEKQSIAPDRSAGFWIRFLSSFIDALFFLILFSVLFILPAYLYEAPKIDTSKGINLSLITSIYSNIKTEVFYWLGAGYIFLAIFYYIYSWTKLGATPGKRLLGIYIFNYSKKTTPIGWGRSLLRYFSYIISTIPLLLGFIMTTFTKDKRALHDIIAGTQVSYRKK